MAADRLGLLTSAALRGLFIIASKLHFAEDAFTLHLLLQRAQRLIDIVVTDEDLHGLPTAPWRIKTSGQRVSVARGKSTYHRIGVMKRVVLERFGRFPVVLRPALQVQELDPEGYFVILQTLQHV